MLEIATCAQSHPKVRFRQHQPWTNWAGTAQWCPEWTFYPRGVEDLIQIVHFARTTGRKIRVTATGHSWTALVPTDEILVCVHQLNQVTMDLSDESHPRVVIESGATGKEVNDVLERHGYALPLNVVLESGRFGGLFATGSHGSGWKNRTLSDLASSLEILTASGQPRTFAMGVDHDDTPLAGRLIPGRSGVI